jgi:hypothetical protein
MQINSSVVFYTFMQYIDHSFICVNSKPYEVPPQVSHDVEGGHYSGPDSLIIQTRGSSKLRGVGGEDVMTYQTVNEK